MGQIININKKSEWPMDQSLGNITFYCKRGRVHSFESYKLFPVVQVTGKPHQCLLTQSQIVQLLQQNNVIDGIKSFLIAI